MNRHRVLEDIQAQPGSLERFLDHLAGPDRVNLQACVEQARAGRRLIVSGMGASFFAGIPLSVYLAQRGIEATVIETSELLHYQKPICDNATLILISRSGETVEITKLLDEIKGRSRVIGVTANCESPLGLRADRTLVLRTGADGLVAIQSYGGTVFALLALGACLTGQFDKAWQARARGTIALLSQVIENLIVTSEGWREFLETGQVLYVTGRGASLASAQEGALLFHEMARASTIGISAAQFRHGPVEVVDPDFRCLVLANQPATRHLDTGLARDLRRFGGKIRIIGPAPAKSTLPDTLFWEMPEAEELFVPLVEIAALQMAAYRTAVWRGIEPGSFRHAAPVTLDEEKFR